MDVHQIAWLSPRRRESPVAGVPADHRPREAARHLGVSENTVQKWVGRSQREGSMVCATIHKFAFPDRWVTVHPVHIGNTFRPLRETQSAVAGVLQDGRTATVRCPPARTRQDGRPRWDAARSDFVQHRAMGTQTPPPRRDAEVLPMCPGLMPDLRPPYNLYTASQGMSCRPRGLVECRRRCGTQAEQHEVARHVRQTCLCWARERRHEQGCCR